MALQSWIEYWDEVDPAVMILVGVLLFVFPEPATSAFGAALALLGVAWLFYEWNR